MQILIPLAGTSPFFPRETYFFPKPLIEVAGVPMIERVVENLLTIDRDAHFIFIVGRDDVLRFSLDRTLKLLIPGRCSVVVLGEPTKGALCSALMAIDEIDLDQPILVSNGDQVVENGLSAIVERFISTRADAGVVTFDSVHPRWSYVEVDGAGQVVEAAEKKVISRNAIAGLYFFRTGKRFVDAAFRSIENDAAVGGQFFIAPCLNEIVLDDGKVLAQPIEAPRYHSFYSPERISAFSDEVLRRSLTADKSGTRLKVVIPAAGEGSRFKAAGYARPKPFLDVRGQTMIDRVIANVTPAHSDVRVLLRKDHLVSERQAVDRLASKGIAITEVDQPTEGTACTLLLARRWLDGDAPLLIANSDQYVDFSVDGFVSDCFDRKLDGSILVFREANRDPKWSYARVGSDGLVAEVAEKQAISEWATVGIYLFARGSDYVRSAIDMIARNDRVRGEFYTCPVYNYAIASGLRIGVYEVPSEAMHGMGTPEDLERYLGAGPSS